MLRFQSPKASAQLRRRWQRIHQHQATGHLHHGEPDRHGYVLHTLKLLKAPHLAGDQLFNMGGSLAVGIQRQQRPPRPALVNWHHSNQLFHKLFLYLWTKPCARKFRDISEATWLTQPVPLNFNQKQTHHLHSEWCVHLNAFIKC